MRLFKYLPPEKGCCVLADCELGVTPPKYLNDAFEASPIIKCKDPEAYARRQISAITSSPEFFEKNRTHFPTVTTFKEFQTALQKVSPQLLRKLVAGTHMVDSHIEENVPEFISKDFGVVCFSEDNLDQTMWAHYASSLQGLVIEFQHNHQLFSGRSFFKIEYSNKRVIFDPSNPAESDEARRFLRRKRECWAYEKEWRLLMNLEYATVHNTDAGSRYFLRIPAELIVSVTLGLRVAPKIKDMITEYLRAPRFENVKLYKIRRNVELGAFECEPA